MHIGRVVARSAAWALSLLVAGVTLAAPGSPLMVLRDASAADPLVISGNLTGMVPGVAGSLVLTVRNDGSEPAMVSGLTARVTAAPAGCPAGALGIGTWQGELAVPAHGAAKAVLPAVLGSSAAGCKGATWSLAYSSR